MALNRTTPATARARNIARYAKNLGIDRNEQVANSACVTKCGASGRTVSECTPCNECGSTTHKSALSFACPEHKCTNCQGTLEPKGHNRNDCPRMETDICDECGETGHSANKCSIRPCNACGLRSHKLQTSHLCPEHVCTLCNGEEEPKGHNHNISFAIIAEVVPNPVTGT